MHSELGDLSNTSIKKYVEGTENVALALDSAISDVKAKGKKPTILIPSRGAVPIYLIAQNILREMDSKHVLANPTKTKHYPDNIFEYLSGQRIKKNGPEETAVDVILYPFTADVASEGKEERLAKTFRYSATRAYLDLISGDRTSNDLNWYFFLMNKMQVGAYKVDDLSPVAIADSLKSLIPCPNRQTILIDTVISGRASSQIMTAFKEQGHPVIPILSVDSVEGSSRLQDTLKNTIIQSAAWDVTSADPFIEYPLITEDKGAALLGVGAINFDNFNEPGVFNSIDSRFDKNWIPQSCVWSLAPTEGGMRDAYVGAFHKFLDKCTRPETVNGAWAAAAKNIKNLTATYGHISASELVMYAKVDKGSRGRESSSHIISVRVPNDQANKWVREFSADLDSRKLLQKSKISL